MMRVCAARLTSQAAAHASRHHGTHNLALTFSGSGMMMVWQMGVASALRCDERFMARVARVLGTSGGACVGAMLLASPPGAPGVRGWRHCDVPFVRMDHRRTVISHS